jgi:hypothetical protein
MSWDLTSKTLASSATIASYDNVTNPGGIIDSFKWARTRIGGCQQLRVQAVSRLVNLPANCLVEFDVDGTRQFKGYVTTPPNVINTGTEEVVITGLKALCKKVVVKSRLFENITDMKTVITDATNGFRNDFPNWLLFDQTKILAGLGALAKYALGIRTLYEVMDDIVARSSVIGLEWDVDEFGYLIVKVPSGTYTTTYADYASGNDVGHLSINADDTVSAVTVLIGNSDPGDGRGYNYTQPHPIAYRYEDPSHATYLQERLIQGSSIAYEVVPDRLEIYTGDFLGGSPLWSAAAPDQTAQYGSNALFQTSASPFLYQNISLASSSPGWHDDNQATFFTVPTPGPPYGDRVNIIPRLLNSATQTNLVTIGIKYNFRSKIKKNLEDYLVAARFVMATLSGAVTVNRNPSHVPLPLGEADAAGDSVYSGTAIMWGSANTLDPQTEIQMQFSTTPSSGVLPASIEISEIKLIVVNLDDLQNFAKSFINLPGALVANLEIQNSIQAPVGFVQVTGIPTVGTQTGTVELWEYEHKNDKLKNTIARIGGQNESETVRNLKIADAAFQARALSGAQAFAGAITNPTR